MQPPGIESALWREMAGLEVDLDERLDQARELTELIQKSPTTSTGLAIRLSALEEEIAAFQEGLTSLRDKCGTLSEEQWRRYVTRFVTACTNGDVAAINQALRLLANKVEVEGGAIHLYLKHGEAAAIPVAEFLLPAS